MTIFEGFCTTIVHWINRRILWPSSGKQSATYLLQIESWQSSNNFLIIIVLCFNFQNIKTYCFISWSWLIMEPNLFWIILWNESRSKLLSFCTKRFHKSKWVANFLASLFFLAIIAHFSLFSSGAAKYDFCRDFVNVCYISSFK